MIFWRVSPIATSTGPVTAGAFGFTIQTGIVTICLQMAGIIKIDTERCKGCGLCIVVCPKKTIRASDVSNKNGYFPAQCSNGECTGCAMCAIICPEAIIEVSTDSDTVEIKELNGRTKKKSLPKQEAGKVTS